MIITTILVIIMVAAIALFVMKNKTGNSEPKTQGSQAQKPPASQEPAPENAYKEITESLIQLNLLIRKDPVLSKEMTLEIEAIIDDLAAVIPAMMDRYPGEALTYEIKKIGRDHLYKTVKEYLDLSPESRGHQLKMFQQTIGSLHDVSKRSRDIVEKNETAEFKTMANFLAGKF